MQEIPWQRWAITFVVLILLGLAADFFFLHFLFNQKRQSLAKGPEISAPVTANQTSTGTAAATVAGDSVNAGVTSSIPPLEETSVDNFLKSLQDCRPDISAQGISTPDALMAYLEKSVGFAEQIKDIENFHIILPDGSERRLHFIPADNTNSPGKRLELRYFKLDAEGYPERIPLKPEQSFDPDPAFVSSLLGQGQLKFHQVKSQIKLKDGGFLALETHGDKVYEFQLMAPRGASDKTLSCRKLSCQCQ